MRADDKEGEEKSLPVSNPVIITSEVHFPRKDIHTHVCARSEASEQDSLGKVCIVLCSAS